MDGRFTLECRSCRKVLGVRELWDPFTQEQAERRLADHQDVCLGPPEQRDSLQGYGQITTAERG